MSQPLRGQGSHLGLIHVYNILFMYFYHDTFSFDQYNRSKISISVTLIDSLLHMFLQSPFPFVTDFIFQLVSIDHAVNMAVITENCPPPEYVHLQRDT